MAILVNRHGAKTKTAGNFHILIAAEKAGLGGALRNGLKSIMIEEAQKKMQDKAAFTGQGAAYIRAKYSHAFAGSAKTKNEERMIPYD